jgi:hypothetical protein
MPAPVVSPTQSVLAYAIGQEFEFRMIATGNPTSWIIGDNDVLPMGIVFNPYTGTLSGSGVVAGVWTINFSAVNADGTSTAVPFNIGIFETPTTEISKRLYVNTNTWDVTLDDAGSATAGAVAPKSFIRYGDDATFKVSFTQDGATIYPKAVSARLSVKGRDTEEAFIITDSPSFKTTAKVNEGYIRTYYIYCNFTSASLLSYLEENESDEGTANIVLCEIEFLFEKPKNAVGPELNKITTKTFPISIYRDTIKD